MGKKNFIFLLILSLTATIYTYGQQGYTLSGKVKDNSGNFLAGAGVAVENTFLGTVCGSDGSYSLDGLREGTYRVRFSFIGFEPVSREITINGNSKLDIELFPQSLLTGEVIVSATRAGNRTPVAYTTLDEKTLGKQNNGQDIPYLLGMTPSLVETSEAGNGIGYTSLRIRGTDANRINVTIDGIPLNDPESQQVFWVDLPDLASSADNIQVQRGAGTSTNGAGAFGATVSIETKSPENEPFASISSSAGSFNTYKNSISAGTGLLADRFALQLRLSQIKSDGYIKRTGSDHRSAYISGVFLAGRSRFKANIILGEEHTGIGWWGVTQEMLSTDRRYNPAGEYTDENGVTMYYGNESDNYRQDHYQLIYGLKINDELNFSSAFHYTRGKGYYEEYREDQAFNDYGLPDISTGDTTISNTDMVRRKWMSNDFYGLVYTLRYNRGRFESSFGGGTNYYSGDHFGQIIWMNNPGNTEKDHQWYLNTGTKFETNIYAKTTISLNEKISVYGDLQYRYILYRISGKDDDLKDLEQKHHFGFVNPKAGLFWAISQRQEGWLSFSMAGREPTRSDFKEAAGDPLSTPEPEHLYDTELGYRFRSKYYSLGVNGYLMYYDNQLVPTGELSNTGYSIMTNVKKSSRIGIEFVAGLRPARFLQWDLNLTLSKNTINDFTEYYIDYDTITWEGTYGNKRLGTVDIAYSPSVTGTSKLNFKILKNLEAAFITKYVGKQYFDNTMSRNRMIDPYLVNNLSISFEPVLKKLKSVEFQVFINNIFNAQYENNAYGGNWYEAGAEKTWAYFFPQAGTNVMFRASVSF